MNSAVEHARMIGLDHLRLSLRGGEQLEAFYERHGWTEFGRHRNALRFGGDMGDRDEVYMSKDL